MALLFSLGILAMMLVLGLVFATNAMIDRKVAAGHNDLTSAKLLTLAAVQRALVAQKFVYDNPALSTDQIRSHVGGGGHIDEIADLFAGLPGGLTVDVGAAPRVEWQFVLDDRSRILGRIAYAFATEDGLDPAACVKTGVLEGSNEERPGVDVSEINLKNLPAPMTAAYAEALSFVADGGALPDGNRWLDFSQLFGYLGITDLNTQQAFREWFVISQTPDPEAMWLDGDADGTIDSGELYHRLNLRNYVDTNNNGLYDNGTDTNNWDAKTVADLIADPVEWSGGGTPHHGTCIPWLKYYTNPGLDPATFPSAEARAMQIIANLIDYNDTNLAITAGPAGSEETDPTYTGNEKTPYLNEIGINVECTINIQREVDGGTGDERFRFIYSFTSQVHAERIDIYGSLTSGCSLEILDGSINYKYASDYSGTPTEVSESMNGVTRAIGGSADAYYSVFGAGPVWSIDTGWLNWRPPNPTTPTAEVTDVKVQIRRAKLSYNGTYCDFAKPDYDNSWSEAIPSLVLLDSVSNISDEAWFSWQANDPRQNLHFGDWAQAKALKTDDYGNLGTPSAVNADVSFAADGDAEAGLSPTTLSTNYHRNDLMKSPWEIGLIHRGAKWETINLKKYNSAVGVTKLQGIGAYADGDANLLDQIKMTGETQVFGKVNINIAQEDVLKALFQDIYVGTDPDTPGQIAGNQVDATKAENIATAILAANGATGGTAFSSRAQIADVAALTDGTGGTQTTDATKEEIISKVVNLLKTRSIGGNTLVVLGQTIKDVGDDVTVVKEIFDTTLGTPAWDTKTVGPCTYGNYNQYADEIMATSKVLAEVAMDPVTRKWRIVRFEYLPE
jgi:hypothetical protein